MPGEELPLDVLPGTFASNASMALGLGGTGSDGASDGWSGSDRHSAEPIDATWANSREPMTITSPRPGKGKTVAARTPAAQMT